VLHGPAEITPTIRLTGLISTLVTDTVTARAIAALLD
jgi:hypothetical protein